MKPTCLKNSFPCSSAVQRWRRGPTQWLNALSLGMGLAILLLIGVAPRGQAAGVQIFGNLANFDVRYPPSLPNDLEIYVYGDGLKTNDVQGVFINGQWGPPVSMTTSVNDDTNSPAFGLDCVVVRYAGPPLPAAVGQLLHFGVRMRIGAAVAHQEVWWTLNGQRILRPCDPHISWICTTTGWLVCIANPTPIPIYIYGARWFPIAAGAPLPVLNQMTTAIEPQAFGAADWTLAPNPGGGRVFCIQPWCRIYIRIQVTRWRPIIFQLAARNVPESVLPLPTGTIGPNPNDWNGEQGTMAILTARPTQEFPEDLTNDGVVGIPDFNQLRGAFNLMSEDRPGMTQ